MPEMELKEKLDRKQFTNLLRDWLEAMEGDDDLEVSVNGEVQFIPAEAFSKGWYRVEYEIDKGEYELELTLKWR
jgi:hypothetical protein